MIWIELTTAASTRLILVLHLLGGLYDIQRIGYCVGPGYALRAELYWRRCQLRRNQANHDKFGAVRWVGGQYSTSKVSSSGPINDTLAYLSICQSDNGGRIEGMGDSEDMEAANDANFALTLVGRSQHHELELPG